MTEAGFLMQGCRNAVAAGLNHIDRQVAALETAVADNTGYVFDLARTLVESVCRTVLDERGVAYEDDDELPRLFRATADCLPFLPPEASGETEARRSLAKTLGGLGTTIQGICELRNAYGFASHGSATPRPDLGTTQGLLAAQAADAIVGFLYQMHTQARTLPLAAREEYTQDEDYNNWIDDQHETIQVFVSTFRPSQVLFEMEPETYRLYRAEFLAGPDPDDGGVAA